MELSEHLSLQEYNSFNVKVISPSVYFLKNLIDLPLLPDLSKIPFYILGDGSNTLFVDEKAPVIIKPEFTGINISETEDDFIVHVGAGENWHNLVCTCLNKAIYGLENLALIPGCVGAAPVQNIGAYGVEFADFCSQVQWFDFSSQSIKILSNQECDFSYRNSVFKQSLYNKGIIVGVVLTLPKKWRANLSYAGLYDFMKDPSPKQVMDQVIRLRQAKLPDPIMTPNAGSFFKNPLVSTDKLTDLKRRYSDIPFYSQQNSLVKLAAGWLIDQAGLKGYEINGVAVHKDQALVIVNYKSQYGKYIVALAQLVQKRVFEKFDILLLPEVRMVTSQGEQGFSDLPLQLSCV